MKEKYITIKGLKHHVFESESTGPDVFMVHGNSSCAKTFENLFNGELSKKFNLIAIDLIGHGKSGFSKFPEKEYSVPYLAKIVKNIIDQYETENFALIGHSIGGHIFNHAISEITNSAALILISAPPMSLDIMEKIYKPDPVNGATFRGNLSDEDVRMFSEALLGPAKLNKTLSNNLKKTIKNTDPNFRNFLGKTISDGKLVNEALNISNTNTPIAMIWGTDDDFINHSYCRELTVKNWLKEGRYPFFGSGHSPHLDQPKKVETLLDSLLEKALLKSVNP